MSQMISNDTRTQMMFEAQKKSSGAAYLLWFFLGYFGAHRFYLGRTTSALAQLLLCFFGWIPFGFGWICLGLWWVVDAFLIPEMIREENLKLIERLDERLSE